MRSSLDKLGSFGAVIAAAACPICFPKLALVGALLGLGGLAAYEAQLFIAAQALVGVAVLGHIVSYRQHRRQWRLASAVVGGGAFFLGLYVLRSEWLAYAGLAALIAGSIPDLRFRLLPSAAPAGTPESIVTCPTCGHRQRETMPTDACLFFYDCKGCGMVLRPKQGDCCVFCSYGTVKCPPKQAAACCTA
jgi:hypothetical protein